MTRGIVEAHSAGTVTSASMVVNTPAFPEAARAARGLPHLSIGLHLNLTAGRPLAPLERVRSLIDAATGRFVSLTRLCWRAATGRLDPSAVAAEYAAQMGRLAEAGLRATHLDSHRHVHLLPGIRPTIAREAARAGLPLRTPVEPWPGLGAAAVAKQVAIRCALAAGGAPAPRAPHFRGMGLYHRPDFRARLLSLLDRLPDGTTEVVVHPGYVDAELGSWDGYLAPREWELAGLLSREVRQRLRGQDPRLVSFPDR